MRTIAAHPNRPCGALNAWTRSVATIMFILSMGLIKTAQGQTAVPAPPLVPEARRTVFDFERKVQATKDTQKQIQMCRDFYRNLKDSETRIEAIQAIDARYVCVIPRSIHGELVEPLLKDPDPKVRLAAAQAFGWMVTVGRKNIGNAGPDMVALLKDPDPQIRTSVLYALGHSGEDPFFAPLKAGLSDADLNVRREAIFELNVWLDVQRSQLQKLAASVTNGTGQP